MSANLTHHRGRRNVHTVVVSPIDRLLVAMVVLAVSLTACETGKPTGGHQITGGLSPTNSSPPPAPRSAAGGPDAQEYGASDGYPVGDRSTYFRVPFLVGSHSHLDQVFEGRLVRRAPTPSPLARAAGEPPISYEYLGQTLTIDDYLARNPATGLLIARDDTILVERYQYGRNDRHRFTSWSMAKTVTAMLVGIAIDEGRIRSVDDPAASYEPALAGTEYGRTSLRDLLQMSSGVRFVEEYSGRDDVSRLAAETFMLLGAGGVGAVTPFNTRVEPGGTKFSYASVETQVLGLVLRRAVGRPVADYMHDKIWAPMGAEADATWLVDRSGQEVTFCCVNAVLRDYARLGLLLAHGGMWRGTQIIPARWMQDATSVRHDQNHLRPGIATEFFGYGYQTWIFPGGERQMFALLGVRGQAIYVYPAGRLVMVHTAVRKRPVDLDGARELGALWRSLVRGLGA
jgi:CubicO group peptidase (beta-lactamase class C family)